MVPHIGVDLGGTRLKAGWVERGQITRTSIRDTPAQAGPDAVLTAVADAVRELDPSPTSVGFAIPGEVNDEGLCYRLPNVPGFEQVPIAKILSEKLGCPVAVENDATSATLGELRFGAGRQYPDFMLLTLGTGIGGGVALNGKVRRGRNGFAGEFGHVQIDRRPDALPCGCGLTGCIEAYAGTRALRDMAKSIGLEHETIKDLADLAVGGNPSAKKVFASMGTALGEAIASSQNLLDLDAVVFTGGISKSFSLIEDSIRASLRRRAFAPPLAEIPLIVSKLGDTAGIVGAALLPQETGLI
jgi:glucokinase